MHAPDRHWHTYERYVGCVLDRGDGLDDARRVWFGKKQLIDQHNLSLELSLKPPVPIARSIECHHAACSHYGMHTLDMLIECITAAGRPIDDAIRCWNAHVGLNYRVPLDVLKFLDDPEAPVPAHEEAAPHTKPIVRRCMRSKCHRTPAYVKKTKKPASLLPVLYSKPADVNRLARVYSRVPDIDGFMRHDGGRYNEATNRAPLVQSVDCGYYGCIRQCRHTFTDLLECCQLDGQHAGNASVIWEKKTSCREVVPYDFLLAAGGAIPL